MIEVDIECSEKPLRTQPEDDMPALILEQLIWSEFSEVWMDFPTFSYPQSIQVVLLCLASYTVEETYCGSKHPDHSSSLPIPPIQWCLHCHTLPQRPPVFTHVQEKNNNCSRDKQQNSFFQIMTDYFLNFRSVVDLI